VRMRQYEFIKDSEVEWIGYIPNHWNIYLAKRFEKHASDLVQTGPFGAQLHASDYVDEGVPLILIKHLYGNRIHDEDMPRIMPERAAELDRYQVMPGDIVFSRVGSVGRIGLVTQEQAGWLISGQMLRLRFRSKEVLPSFLMHAISSDAVLTYFDLRVVGTTRDSINTKILSAMPLPLPPLPEQRVIADFLDRKTKAIDDLIQKKERLIELLQEKRQALITQAVTKGLNPTVPMKDSGIEWLGEIPEHWTRTTMKRVCLSVRDGTHNPPPRGDGEYRLLSARNIQNGTFILRDDDRIMTEDVFYELERSYTIREGDVVVAIVGATTGKSAVVGPVEKASVQRSIAILRPNPVKTTSEHLNAWITGDRLQHGIQLVASKYAAQGGIYLEDLANLTCVLPPRAEQHKILYWLAPRFDKIDTTTDRLQQQIDRLREYRQALISAVVTGKIDVTKETT
jgi:type I restriction enzyme S subunit